MAWHEAPGAEALAEDESIGLELGGQRVAICRSRGALHAVDNVCSHQFALLSDGFVENGCIECPLHQGRFDLATGAAQGAPVTEPIRVFPVRVEAGKIYVQIPD